MSNYLIEEITFLKNRIEELENYIEYDIFSPLFPVPSILDKTNNSARRDRLEARVNRLLTPLLGNRFSKVNFNIPYANKEINHEEK